MSSPSLPLLHTRERIDDPVYETDRLRVPGGWIYRFFDEDMPDSDRWRITSAIFVPDNSADRELDQVANDVLFVVDEYMHVRHGETALHQFESNVKPYIERLLKWVTGEGIDE